MTDSEPAGGATDAGETTTATEAAAGTAGGGDPAIDRLAEVWASVAELCADLDDEQWHLDTSCPGWTVKDHLSHMVGPEALFLGRPQPGVMEVPPPYVRNAIGAANESAVDYRRSWSGPDVLAEFNEVTGLRMERLRATPADELDEESWTPAGQGTLRDLLAIRAFDAWVHEQDMRDALGRPGDDDTPAAAHSLTRCMLAMPYVVGKKVGPPDGTTVVFDVTGPTTGELGIRVTAGRARALEAVPEAPTATLTMDFATFVRLGCGRIDPEATLADGKVELTGDSELGEAIVLNMAFMI